jgi:molybdate transport system permease protein
MGAEELRVVFFTLQMAATATVAILVPGVAAAFLLAGYRGPGKSALETLLSLPLVLPPTAVGLALLELLGRNRPIGAWLAARGIEVVFTWKAVVLATAVMSFPLLVRSARTAFEEVNPRLVGLARTLGAVRAPPRRVSQPPAGRGVPAGTVPPSRAPASSGSPSWYGASPAHADPALAIFHDTQLGRDERAAALAAVTVVLAFTSLWVTEWLVRRRSRTEGA